MKGKVCKMDQNIMEELYKFPVESRVMYFPVTDKYGNVSYSEALKEGNNKVMGIIRKDEEVLLGVCSEKYKIIEHSTVKDYADRLMKELGYTVSSSKMELPNHGSTMLYYNILNDEVYNIGDINIKAAIECKNSYNGTENASINVVFVNEENTIFGFGFKKESKVSNSVFIKHHGQADDKVKTEFGGLIEYIPATIQNTVKLWNVWNKQNVDGKKIKLLCRGISAGFANYCKELGLFDTGCSRFEFYAKFCRYNVNLGTIGRLYKSQKLSINKMNNLFLMDELYIDDLFAAKLINKIGKFEYDEFDNPKVKKLMNSRTFNAIKNDTVSKSYQINEPKKLEQIVEEPASVVEETPSVVEPVTEVTEGEDPDKLLEGW